MFLSMGTIPDADSKLLPMVVAVILVALGTGNLLYALFAKKKQEYDFSGSKKVLLVLAVFSLYIVLTDMFGIYICTPFFLAGCMLILGQRNKVVLVAVPIVTTVVIAVLFRFVFTIPMPTGRIFNPLAFIGLY